MESLCGAIGESYETPFRWEFAILYNRCTSPANSKSRSYRNPSFSKTLCEAKLIGNVQGSGPFKGKLVHRGWRASSLKLPAPMQSHDASVLAPAEVEL